MIDDLPRDEAERPLSLSKFGDPSTGWRRHQETVSLAKCVFGVTDADGRRIPGITARFSVRYGRRPPFRRFVFGIYHCQHQRDRRAYQLEIFQGNRPVTDLHRNPHEHVDRLLPEQADREVAVIGQYAEAWPMRKLIEAAEGGGLARH